MKYSDFCLLEKGDLISIKDADFLSNDVLVRVISSSNDPIKGINGLDFELVRGSINQNAPPYYKNLNRAIFHTQLYKITKFELKVCV